MTINNDLLDELLKDYQKPEGILGENGLLKQLTKTVLERALQAELTHHLGYDKHSPSGNNSSNSRNGKSKKTRKWICKCSHRHPPLAPSALLSAASRPTRPDRRPSRSNDTPSHRINGTMKNGRKTDRWLVGPLVTVRAMASG
jgi:Transposase, Mutator family